MTPPDAGPKALTIRSALPDDVPLLANGAARADWKSHPDYPGLVQFWLDRHDMFPKLTEAILGNTAAFADKAVEETAYSQSLAQHGSLLLNQLQTHHQVEDHHYFPMLIKMEPGLSRGFELLDGDHTALDGALHHFAETANAILGRLRAGEPATDEAKAFAGWLGTFGQLLARHLEDEEDIVIPVLLKHRVR